MGDNKRLLEGAAVGTLFILIGNAVGMGLGFLIRIAIARFTNPSTYGLVVLGVAVLNVLTIFSLLGLEKGIARNIPISNHPSKLVSSSIQSITVVSLLLSVIFGAGILFYPGISGQVQNVILIFILGVPFLAILRLTKGIFQGTEDTISKVLSQDLARRIFVVFFVVVASVIGLGATGIAAGWVAGIAISTITGLTLVVLRSNLWQFEELFQFDRSTAKSLIIFSLPIMLSDSTWKLMQEIDNILLGYLLQNTSSIGIYDASYTIAKSLLIFLWTFQFLFLPIFTKLYDSNNINELNKFYSTATKWLISLALPTVVVIVFHAKIIIRTIFDTDYISGGDPLAVLAFGFFIFIITGLSRHALTAIGKTKLIFVASILSLFLDAILNIILIPVYGILGAAIATASAFIFANLILLGILYRRFGIHPVSLSLLLSTGVASIAVVSSNNLFKTFVTTVPRLVLISMLSLVLSLLCFVLIGKTEQDERFISDLKNQNM